MYKYTKKVEEEVVSVGRATIFCLSSAIFHIYFQFQGRKENFLEEELVGKEGDWFHQIIDDKRNRKNQKRIGARAQFKGDR